MLLRLAVRNLWRNGRRSFLTVTGIALALALMLISQSIQNGAWGALIKNAIQAGAGHVVVQADGWQEERDPELWMDGSTALRDAVGEAYPGAIVVRRTFVGGLLTSPTGSAAVTVQGIEPSQEAELTLLDDRLRSGAWLTDDGERGILLGEVLAQTLGVGLDDKVVLMAQVGTDDMESRLFRVKGTFRTGSDALDAFGAYAHVDATQAVMGGDDPAHQIAVVWPEIGRDEPDLTPAREALAGHDGLDIMTWRGALPLLEEQEALDAKFNNLIYVVMAAIVAVGVLNTILMGVMERMREFGVMLAVGMKPGRLARMVVLEGFLLGLVGGVAALAIAAGPIWALQTYGIDYGDLFAKASPVGGIPIDTVMRAQASAWQSGIIVAMGAFVAFAASLWPARKATHLQPVEAIRHL